MAMTLQELRDWLEEISKIASPATPTNAVCVSLSGRTDRSFTNEYGYSSRSTEKRTRELSVMIEPEAKEVRSPGITDPTEVAR